MRVPPPRSRPPRRAQVAPAAPDRGSTRRRLLGLCLLLDVLLLALACQMARVSVEYADERLVLGQWQDLDVGAWTEATTGFRGPGQPDATPMQVVRSATDQVLQIVQDSQLAAPISQERRRAEVQRIADRLFDFQEMARRTLAPAALPAHGDGERFPVGCRPQTGARCHQGL